MHNNLKKVVFFVILSLFVFALIGCEDENGVDPEKESYMVTFSKNLDDVTVRDVPLPQNVIEGEKVVAPTKEPSANDYVFTGWYKDSAATQPFNFETDTVTGRLTLYAGWELLIISYNAEFDLNYDGAPDLADVEVIEDELLVEPNTPVRNNYQFKFWSTDPVLEYVYDFATPVTSDLKLYAIWEAIYTITYDFNLEG